MHRRKIDKIMSKASESLEKPLRCIVCATQLEPIYTNSHVPNEGTLFSSRGNYGSTVFDTVSQNTIEIVVCDVCLNDAIAANSVAYVVPEYVERKVSRTIFIKDDVGDLE